MSLEVTGNNAAAQTQQAAAAENQETKPKGEPDSEMPKTVSNLTQLKDVSPEFYDEMLKAIFNDIKSQQEKSQQRVKKLNREAYQ